jgi:hypothetical protein
MMFSLIRTESMPYGKEVITQQTVIAPLQTAVKFSVGNYDLLVISE